MVVKVTVEDVVDVTCCVEEEACVVEAGCVVEDEVVEDEVVCCVDEVLDEVVLVEVELVVVVVVVADGGIQFPFTHRLPPVQFPQLTVSQPTIKRSISIQMKIVRIRYHSKGYHIVHQL